MKTFFWSSLDFKEKSVPKEENLQFFPNLRRNINPIGSEFQMRLVITAAKVSFHAIFYSLNADWDVLAFVLNYYFHTEVGLIVPTLFLNFEQK